MSAYSIEKVKTGHYNYMVTNDQTGEEIVAQAKTLAEAIFNLKTLALSVNNVQLKKDDIQIFENERNVLVNNNCVRIPLIFGDYLYCKIQDINYIEKKGKFFYIYLKVTSKVYKAASNCELESFFMDNFK